MAKNSIIIFIDTYEKFAQNCYNSNECQFCSISIYVSFRWMILIHHIE